MERTKNSMDLFDLMNSKGPLQEKHARKIFRQVFIISLKSADFARFISVHCIKTRCLNVLNRSAYMLALYSELSESGLFVCGWFKTVVNDIFEAVHCKLSKFKQIRLKVNAEILFSSILLLKRISCKIK